MKVYTNITNNTNTMYSSWVGAGKPMMCMIMGLGALPKAKGGIATTY